MWRCRWFTGVSIGSQIAWAEEWSAGSNMGELVEVVQRLQRAPAALLLEIADEGGARHGHEDRLPLGERHVLLRVAGMQRDLFRYGGHLRHNFKTETAPCEVNVPRCSVRGER